MNYESLLNCNPKAELAKRNFDDFVTYLFPAYEMKWFHKHICEKLNDFNRGYIKKLMVFMPPQHGKSQLTTRLFPAYTLGVHPNKKVVVASYNATLASRFNRDIQRIIDTDLFHDIFPKTLLNESNVVTVSESYLRNSEIFEIVGYSGFLKTVGRGGALTGTPVDLGIIDDPIKDRAEAMSETIRESLWSWYQDVFETRLHNDSQQLLIQTRWHEDDLAGRLLRRDKDWDVIVFEAIKENDFDYDPRKKGEALWPEKHSFDRINKVRLTSPLTFNSLYQQNPIPMDDIGIFWDKNILKRHRIKVKPQLERIIVAIDPATTNSSTSDETGIMVQGIDNVGNGYLIEDLSGKYSPNEWATIAVNAVVRHDAVCIVAEKNQGGDMVGSIIRQHDQKIRIKLVTASKGKEVRAEPIFGLYEQSKIYHVGEFPELENQMVLFNPKHNDKSPDRVDALVWGFTELMIGTKTEVHFGW
ncbi:MAG TPA: terminase family protein [Ignavibacteriaceae bacterium]